MSFNKRSFSIEMLANYCKDNRELGIQIAIGKTDCFFFTDNDSKTVLDLWFDGKKEDARELIDNYVSRIALKTSSNN